MIKIFDCTGNTIMYPVLHSSSDISIGSVPINILGEREPYTINSDIIIPGDSIDREHGVVHHKLDGSLNRFDPKYFKTEVLKPTDQHIDNDIPPMVFYRTSATDEWTPIGNLLVPHFAGAEIYYESDFYLSGKDDPSPRRQTVFARWDTPHLFVYGLFTKNKSGYCTYSVGYCHYNSSFQRRHNGFTDDNFKTSAEMVEALRHPQDHFHEESEWKETWNYACSSMTPIIPLLPDTFIYRMGHLVRTITEESPCLNNRRFSLDNVWGELAHRAVESFDALHINSMAYIKDATSFGALLPPTKDLKRILKSPKAAGNVYLWARYGASLTYKDTVSLFKAFTHSKNRKDSSSATRLLRASQSLRCPVGSNSWNIDCHYRIKVATKDTENEALERIIESAHKWDFYPTRSNLWDLIPYSFVLDWFLPIQDKLSDMDDESRLRSFHVYSVTYSEKWNITHCITPDQYGQGLVGSLTETYYSRHISDTPHHPHSYDLREDVTHYQRFVDGAALLLQKFSH